MKSISRFIAASSILVLLGAGCGSTTPRASETASEASPSPAVARSNGQEDCFNLYYPLKTGSAIAYRMKSGTMETPFTIRVVERTSTTVKLEYTFTVQGRESKLTNNLVCENGAIKSTGYFDIAQAFTGMEMSFDTISMEGEILPSDLAIGRAWNLATEVEIHTTNAQMKAMLDGRRQKSNIASKVIGEETVTVPAGTFNALKIEQTITMESAVMGAHSTTTANAWYVKDVGLVKSDSTFGTTVSTMEAMEITQE
ncbi:MAG: hypothetical protein WC787_00660 [Patescibacteria group bacterium]|jgi:hypothetical protein